MAYRTVETDPNFGNGKFLKMKDVFQNVGDEFTALYQSDGEGTYGPEYTWKQRSGEVVTMTIGNKQLAIQLKKAKLQFNEKVTIKFTSEKDVQKDSPMKLFQVRVEDAPKGASAKPPPPKPAAPKDDWDDINQ